MSVLTISAYTIATVLVITACFIFYYLGKAYGKSLGLKNNAYQKVSAYYKQLYETEHEKNIAARKSRTEGIKRFMKEADTLLNALRAANNELYSLREANEQKRLALKLLSQKPIPKPGCSISEELIADSSVIVNKSNGVLHEA